MVACVLIGVCCNIWKIYCQIEFLANYFYMWMKRCWANFQRVGQLVRDGWIGIACFQPPSFLWWFLKLMLGEGGSGCWALTDWKESCSGMRCALHNANCNCNCIMQSAAALHCIMHYVLHCMMQSIVLTAQKCIGFHCNCKMQTKQHWNVFQYASLYLQKHTALHIAKCLCTCIFGKLCINGAHLSVRWTKQQVAPKAAKD